MRLAIVLLLVLGVVGARAQTPLPDGLAASRDLRGPYRAALCARAALAAEDCGRSLLTFAGEAAAPRPAPAVPNEYRLLFVPGFLAACFPGIHSFSDVIEAARDEGFAAETLAVGGRNGVAANARLLAEQVDRLPADGRRLVFVGHSKGVADILEMLGSRPDIAARTQGVLSIAGAVNGSPLADTFRGFYASTVGVLPFRGCDRGEGDPVGDLTPAARKTWWASPQARSGVPVYSVVTMPDLGGLSPGMLLPYLRLARTEGRNDGMLLVRDQVAPGGTLLGVVDADHLRVAIPFPGAPFVLLFSAEPFPRAAMVLAAVDVMAAAAPQTAGLR